MAVGLEVGRFMEEIQAPYPLVRYAKSYYKRGLNTEVTSWLYNSAALYYGVRCVPH